MSCPHACTLRSPAVGPLRPVCTPVPAEVARRFGPVDSPHVVYSILSPKSVRLKHERAWMLLLTRDMLLQVESLIGEGESSEVTIDLDWALSCARTPATPFCILAHNHPSGSAWPSWEDARLTRDMVRAAAAQGIQLLDHVVLGRGEVFSFAYDQGIRL